MDKIVSNKNNIGNLKASKENFAQLLEESFNKENKKVGGLVKGTVVAIEKDTVLVDIGFKSEGRVPIKEFTFKTVLTKPFIKPIKKQKINTEKKPRNKLPLMFITSITITVTKDKSAPTDKSTSPLVNNIVIPKATIITVELDRKILLIF